MEQLLETLRQRLEERVRLTQCLTESQADFIRGQESELESIIELVESLLIIQ